jgi:hypothetical protein
MPTYSLRAPNGKTYEIEGPAGASEAQVRAEILRRDPTAARVNAVKDAAKAFGSNVAKAASGFAGSFGDAAQNAVTGTVRNALLVGQVANGGRPLAGADAVTRGTANALNAALPSGQRLDAKRQAAFGPDYEAQTMAGRYMGAAGSMAANALVPGGAVRRIASVAVPAVASEGAGQIVEGLGGGTAAANGARVAGALIGGVGVGAVRANPRAPAAIRNLPRQNPADVVRRTQEYRAVGIQPTLVDVLDDSGRGAVRAAASRMTPGRQQATDFADTRALNLPSRMGGQARRTLSQDPRTPDQIREAMATQRRTNANANFGAVRGQEITMSDDTVLALRTDAAREAIRAAAQRERDPETRRRLLGLAEAALDAPAMPITVGMADRVSRVLLGRANAAARSGDTDLAQTLGDLGRDIRNPAASAVPGYRTALDQYGADSRLSEAAGVGEDLLTRNTDEFTALAQGLSPEERQLALAAARRAIERKAGENPASAPGVARTIANAPEQQARTAALAGPDRAQQLQQGMRMEERLVRNANDVAPRFGSQTQNKGQDAAVMAEGVARAGGQVARGDWVGIGLDWLRSRGMNDAQAERLVQLATDPAQVDHVMRLLTARYGRQQAQQFLTRRRAAMLAATTSVGAGSTAVASEPQQ